MDKATAYKLLGLPNTCKDEDEIKKAFKKLAMKHHPDKKDGNETVFKQLLEAKDYLIKYKDEKLYSINGQVFSETEIREFVKRSASEMADWDKTFRVKTKVMFLRMLICGLYLLKWAVFMMLGISGPIISLVSLSIYALLLYKAPLIAELHTKYKNKKLK